MRFVVYASYVVEAGSQIEAEDAVRDGRFEDILVISTEIEDVEVPPFPAVSSDKLSS